MRTKHDFVILGGGISGLIASHFLKDEDYILVEKDKVMGGATTRPSSLGGVRLLPDTLDTRELMADMKLPVYECWYTIFMFWQGRFYNLLEAARSFELSSELLTILNDYCRKTRKQSYYSVPEEERDSVMSGIQTKMHEYVESIPYIGGLNFLMNNLILESQSKTFVGKVDKIDDKAIFMGSNRIDFDYLINTIPLDSLLEMLGTPVDLRYIPIRFLNVKPEEPKDVFGFGGSKQYPMYIYFPGLSVPFHRMSFPQRFHGIGGGISEFLIETTELEIANNDKIWDFLERIGVLDKGENIIVEEYTQDLGHFHYSEGAQALVKELEDFDVYCLGRYAEWNHNANIGTTISRMKGVLNGIRASSGPRTHA